MNKLQIVCALFVVTLLISDVTARRGRARGRTKSRVSVTLLLL
jgi:hypothetical protein